MVVVDQQPNEWVLLRRGADYFMEVTSGISYQPFSIIIQLDDMLTLQVATEGRIACQAIAVHVADEWLDCDIVSDSDEAEVYEAIHKWRSHNSA